MKVELKNINKSFGQVQVLKDVQIEILPGEVHALMGENGAGKSTLIKILTGVYSKDGGQIFINDKEVDIKKVRDSQELGIGYVAQELNVVNEMTILENMFLGHEIKKSFFTVDEKIMKEKCVEKLGLLGIILDPEIKMKDLSVGFQQMIEIAQALLYKSELIILDEPTAALTNKEIDNLFKIIKLLKSKGQSFLYVSHRMEEIFDICDRVSVLRDGQYVGTRKVIDTSHNKLVEMMVGRSIDHLINFLSTKKGNVVLRVENLSKEGKFENINFSVHEGEILGFSGLMGSGRTEIMHAIFGSDRPDSGNIYIYENLVNVSSPLIAKNNKMAFVTEDRKDEGLILDFEIKENVVLPSLPEISKNSIVDEEKSINITNEKIQELNIKANSYAQKIKDLSGGNQQKVVFAKWLETKPKILILDEPTKGVDVGAKREIYNIINELKKQGTAIILVSSELPEVIGISDRIAVMHNHKIAHIFNNHDEFDQEKILGYAFMGGKYDENQK